MFIAVDIGNSNIKCAIFNREKEIFEKFSIETDKNNSDYAKLTQIIKKKHNYYACVISSVVPELNDIISNVIFNRVGITPIFLNTSRKCGLIYKYSDPSKIGADRLANVLSGISGYNHPLIIVDFGTATTVSLSLAENEFSGGLIAPGIKTSLEALHYNSSKLPKLNFEHPFEIEGTSTEQCIRSGVYYMHLGFIEHLKNKLKAKYITIKSICTGGFSIFFKDLFDVYDPDMVLKGCFEYYKRINQTF